ncbi:signal peptidase I [Cellulomonas sp. KRMCY2]|uniref:signal peptidase I n=1 Tax=Cellulomonas sp. KRMCY2 TaxID=1304865 RepID=UPI00045E634B|nr:signal peptidase I [Cellulomonas sp. KRMCY2]
MKRRVVLLIALTGLLVVLLAPPSVGGSTSYVITRGASMEPRFHTGDLAVVRAGGDYSVGDVVAYRSDLLNSVVMHRIVAVEDGRYTFQGDNNSWLDPEQPTATDLIGALVVRVPQGGTWLERVTGPVGLGVVAFALVAGGGTAAHTRHRRRARGAARHSISRPSRPSSTSHTTMPTLAAAPPWMRTAAAGTGVLGVLGLALGALAWTGPLTEPTVGQEPTGRTMTFSYTASVPPSAAYDGTTVTSPSPVFRTLADTVDVQLAYRGPSGQITVDAELSTAGGWRSTVPLTGPVDVADDQAELAVRLDLVALEARAQAAALATGMPADQVTVDVVASVQSGDLPAFAPALHLLLSDLQLRLVGDASALTVVDAAVVDRVAETPRSIAFGNVSISVATGRAVSGWLALGSLLVAAALIVALRRMSLPGEDAEIRNRYGSMIVVVQPMVTPAGRPVVDVPEFATLAKIAERYGLLVLHWTRSGVGTFVVQDEGTTYRYRASVDAPPRARGRGSTAAAAPDRGLALTATHGPPSHRSPDVGAVRPGLPHQG